MHLLVLAIVLIVVLGSAYCFIRSEDEDSRNGWFFSCLGWIIVLIQEIT